MDLLISMMDSKAKSIGFRCSNRQLDSLLLTQLQLAMTQVDARDLTTNGLGEFGCKDSEYASSLE